MYNEKQTTDAIIYLTGFRHSLATLKTSHVISWLSVSAFRMRTVVNIMFVHISVCMYF